MKLIKIKEGKAEILVPDPKSYEIDGKFDPSWAPVFYNPKMTLNRDLSVVVLSVLKPKKIVDALSASGIRGIRYFKEIEGVEKVIFNDLDKNAVELINKNIELNKVKGEVFNKDANALLHEIKADFIDIDPFGSPAPFLLSAFNAVVRGGYVAITSTDLSALVCSSKYSARRKYDIYCERLSFSRELGVRGLIGKAIREAAILEKAAIPIFSFYYDYYYRVFFKVEGGAKRADNLLSKLVYYYECPNCGYRERSEYYERIKCTKCGTLMRVYGPAWGGELYNTDLVSDVKNKLQSNFTYLPVYNHVTRLVSTVENEAMYTQPYYKLDFLSSRLKKNVPAKNKVISCLSDASNTHFDNVGIKTSKNVEEVIQCIKIN
ncbi:tRNA (guanine(26)-N(2))-dimethyltransferase [Stygiolobus caldivivus]|uniref:tRNA (guanine(26)-N(2))-dimethyltransferase n=1 Tax=Stygiolobus caldivivus TaxID=2824673 RepID=A0A8D5U8U2_9CREN|nr:tRNA (guanine(26)-N(2))-dimethyltransferase [Stygiolobus caldivivus]BCU71165.1 N2,N2-dimethylguanosine tRNA methyltransferase [Stygiolobus caldivivus]